MLMLMEVLKAARDYLVKFLVILDFLNKYLRAVSLEVYQETSLPLHRLMLPLPVQALVQHTSEILSTAKVEALFCFDFPNRKCC